MLSASFTWRRIRRARRHTAPLDWFAIVCAMASTGATVYYQYDHDEKGDMSTVIGAAAVGLGVFITLMVGWWAVRFGYRLVTGRAPRGSARTLDGLCTRKVEDSLREGIPPRPTGITVMFASKEVQDFAREIQQLLERCGWHVSGDGFALGSESRDVEIYLPEGGNRGLVEFGKWLNAHGYKCTVHDGGPIEAAQMEVGEATQGAVR